MADIKDVNIDFISDCCVEKTTRNSLSKAILTHYLHNFENGISKHYEKDAFNIIDQYISHVKKEHNISIDKSILFNKLIKEVSEVPFPPPKKHSFTFIDLFAGLGGFRIAMQELNGKCVFSSEWDKDAQKTYKENFGEYPFGDITKQEVKNFIPDSFDLLCAGFPCQPFSKGGFQNGFEDTRGTLFFDICEIIEKHKPKYLLLENVANLASHDNGNTYRVITKNLDKLGYYFPDKPLIISPDSFGIPILRPRVYIPCIRKEFAKGKESLIKNFREEIEKHFVNTTFTIDKIIDPEIEERISPYEEKVLKMWDDFYKGIDIKVIGFPIWMEYFKFDGDLNQFPLWKAKIISKNINLYQKNKKFIDDWLKKYDNLDWCVKTHRKMEWQAGDKYESVFDCLIQFRPSGVRIKKPDKFSTLVAMNHRQIIGKLKRKISVEEAKLLQSFPKEYKLVGTPNTIFKQLGNSVNVTVVKVIFNILSKYY
ncbi:MAG: DNA cytosine methyltransferase [Tenuifilum sp.]|uniref:DNA cytosine methyltransferase n=1 Tax=Tenuifilum sp. TaxID=2760880 RepID=UPI001B50355B|nr:DNA cytosine methyltransferase [Bacteroidales bacterium]HOK61286.1 DNA cytosine methyltransferase [Tenuifilum sp.]MBP9029970.1 DNA cytosine methyltransferase [Bacteroidales bacterium]HOK85800.1 DNA cytosine methyltransferase [Tenuifilum sp.]HON70863.1 DNA cytosine methyltransferase [Tenuifilum sp.]